MSTLPFYGSPAGRCRGRLFKPVPSLVLILGLALITNGCKKAEPPPKPADANPVDTAAPEPAQEKARVAQAVAHRSGVEPAAPALQLKGGELATPEVLAAFNQELARQIFKHRDAPETLEELVRKWQLPRLPTPPAGKRIVYDAVNRVIRLDPP